MAADDDSLERVIYKPGEIVFREGETGDRAYIVERGIIEIAKTVGGRKLVLGTIERDGIFGEMALLDESARLATASALIETVCIPVPKTAIVRQLADADALLKKLVQVLLSNARSLSDHMTRAIEEDVKQDEPAA